MTELPRPRKSTICPFCGHAATFDYVENNILSDPFAGSEIDIDYSDTSGNYILFLAKCPGCGNVAISRWKYMENEKGKKFYAGDNILLWPRGSKRPVPSEVPEEIANDYKKACEVLYISEFASAILARRCLQHIIHDAAEQHEYSLDQEIKAIKKTLPDELRELPTLIRLLGKIAAHPQKDYKTNEVITVEPEEAELALSAIEHLFEHYYVRPAKTKKIANQIKTKASRIQKSPKKK